MTQYFTRKHAFYFIIFLGIVSLFADMTYEGARSITGAYLAVLGASATIVGFVAGFGELIGYGLRLVSGFLADRTGRYWFITIFGYAVNLLAVPLLALTNHWPQAAILIILERLGKSIRTPARDAMLSHAGEMVGMGFGFGLHQALDQIGAMLGPLIVALVLYLNGSFQQSFAILAIPALLALMVLVLAFKRYPNPKHLKISLPTIETHVAQKTFWIYLAATALIAAGFADFPLIAYHFQKTSLLSKTWIPIAYGMAMGLDALFAPLFGYFYDRFGFIVFCIIVFLAAFFAPLVFLGNALFAFIGVAIWAIGLGAQESLMRAIVGNMVPSNKRGSAYGVFNLCFGVSWFIGSVLIGMIYDHSIPWVIAFIMLLQFAAIPLLIVVMKKIKRRIR